MAITSDNPMGTGGFEFVEYSTADPELLDALFKNLGFVAVARHHAKRGAESRQGSVSPMDLDIPARRGIGGSLISLIDRYGGHFQALVEAIERDQTVRGVI